MSVSNVFVSTLESWLSEENRLMTLITTTLGYLLVRYHRIIWVVIRTLPRDLKGSFRIGKALLQLIRAKTRNKSVGDAFNETVAKYPDKVCFYFEEEVWSFKEVGELANQVGNYFGSHGYGRGDVVGIFMENCPQYLPLWLGLSKIGVVPALVNANLRMESLKHSVEIVKCKAVIYGEELSDAIQDLLQASYLSVPIFSCSSSGLVKVQSAINLLPLLKGVAGTEPVPKGKINFTDNLYYIYTSGTTGLPKAATIKHARFYMAVLGVHHFHDLKAEDIMYTTLPLYHSAGGMLGLGQAVLFGTSIALRKKFSASNFWSDCVRYKVTVIQYIGEVCRYLLAQPPSSLDTGHQVRIMLGNGMRKEVWAEFVQRFSIPEVAEFYASTEGNANITNIDSKFGAVGFVPRLFYPLVHFKIIKVNERTGEIVRDPKTGLAIRCGPNESGELVGTIVKNHIYKDFQGYAGGSEHEKQKVARDVLRKGDTVFRSGDLMLMDELGYIYFKDRCGDTFRWKGENVSTAEVESVISSICKLQDCVVYGVRVPGTEGRAGMAAIVSLGEKSLDFEALVQGMEQRLPPYARPLFIRLTTSIDTTGTFKMKKIDLQKEGFDVEQISDPLYFLQGGKYELVDQTLYKRIMSGVVRL